MNTQTAWISGSIIIAGALIAGAILFQPTSGAGGGVAGDDYGGPPEDATLEDLGVRPVTADDHIKNGDENSKIAIIEYSDFECPFCARLHPTLDRISAENEDVSWVYRHLPLTQIHPNALPGAIASECVADLAGNDAFWSYTDTLFANIQNLNPGTLRQFALDLGVDGAAYDACIAEDAPREAVAADTTEAGRAGGRGTPFSIIVTEDGQAIPFSGALPYETVDALVQELL